MGKWKEYTVFRNPKCTCRDKNGHPPWRSYARGPECCFACNTPFRVPVWAGTGRDGWKVQDSKGRSVPAAYGGDDRNDGIVGNDGNGGIGGKGGKGGKGSGSKGGRNVSFKTSEDPDSEFRALFKEKFKEDPKKLELLEAAFPTPPEAPKTPENHLKESIAEYEKAQSAYNHLAHTCENMEEAYFKRCKELKEYKERLDSHRQQMQEAHTALKTAKDDLAKLQLEQATSAQSKPFVASRDPNIILASYNPVQGVAHTMSSIEGFDKIPEELASALQRGVAGRR